MEKLFIKLFQTPNGRYFFEPNKNEFVRIHEDTYVKLYECLEKHQLLEENAEIRELKASGYLSSKSNVESVKHPMTDYLEYFMERKLPKITLQLTQSCNFRCKYCIYSETTNSQQRTHSSKHMSWEMAKKAVDFLWERSIDSDRVNIGFYGGEPLLEFDLIKKTVDYCRELFVGKKVSYAITSNGTLLTEEIIHYLASNDFMLLISLDGPKEINDQNRVFINGEGTYDTVMEKLQLIKACEPDFIKKVSFSMVMDPKNDFDCINSIYVDAGDMNKWNINAALVDTDYDMEPVKFSEAYTYKYGYNRFLALLSYLGRIDRDLISPIAYQGLVASIQDWKQLESMPGLMKEDVPSGPCVPGQLRLFVNVDGDFFPCERVSELSGAMRIGSLDTGFDYEKIKALLNVGALTKEQCKKCWCFRYCNICAKKADENGEKLSAKRKMLNCADTQNLVYESLLDVLLLKEISEFYPEQVRLDKERQV